MIERILKRWNGRFALEAPPSTGLKEGLQWAMLARLLVLYGLLTIVVLEQVFGKSAATFPLEWGYGLLAASFAFNLFFALALENIPPNWYGPLSHLIFDAVAISLWIALAPGRENLFALLYLIQILVASLTFYKRGALTSAAIACVAYAVVSFPHLASESGSVLSWIVYSAIFLLVGLVGGYLSEELVRATQSLKEKSKRIEKLTELHELILSNMPTGLLTVDGKMRIHFINPAGEQILGKQAREVVGRGLLEVGPELMPFFSQIESENITEEEDEVKQASRVEAALSATGTEHHRSIFLQTNSQHRKARLQQTVEVGHGKTLRVLRGDVADLEPAEGFERLLASDATSGRVLLFQDVTKLVHLEEKLKQHEKLAAVGQLAAGIAHEIRNPLASMSASIEMLRGSLPEAVGTSENRKLMDIAIREIDRLNRLISEFLDFVKPEKLKRVPVDLGKMLSEVAFTVKNGASFRNFIVLKESYRSETLALGAEEKLKQVAWNLLVNAAQAMKRPGTIEVGCDQRNDQRVLFWVEDEGEGMSEEVLSHLYEPFFTTKDKGTGLGLATAYKIIEAHQGEIRVTSKKDRGTRFEVHLPRS